MLPLALGSSKRGEEVGNMNNTYAYLVLGLAVFCVASCEGREIILCDPSPTALREGCFPGDAGAGMAGSGGAGGAQGVAGGGAGGGNEPTAGAAGALALGGNGGAAGAPLLDAGGDAAGDAAVNDASLP